MPDYYCDKCGESLTVHTDEDGDVLVEPCETCTDDAWHDGYETAEE